MEFLHGGVWCGGVCRVRAAIEYERTVFVGVGFLLLFEREVVMSGLCAVVVERVCLGEEMMR